MGSSLIDKYANILHVRFGDTFANYPKHTINSISPVNVFARIWRVTLYTGGRLILPLIGPGPKNQQITGKIWLYVVSQNNYESLAFLKEKLPHTVFVAGQHKEIGIYNKRVNRLSNRFKLFYYDKFLPLLWGLYRLKGKRALRFFDLIYAATGYYEISKSAIKQYRPTAIIFANDHNTDSRALLLAAREADIPTVYIQHASVSTSFPPLQFHLSLLEGQDAWDKYRQCGPIIGDVKLIGMPKADPYLAHKNRQTTIRSIGICANTIDEILPIEALIKALNSRFPDIVFTFRPHPNDKREFGFIRQLGSKAIFSDGKTEPIFTFLQKQDALIAADTSVHLEATMLNILCVYYRFNDPAAIYDYYGYVQHGIAQPATSLQEVVELIGKYKHCRPQVYDLARYYNAVLGTEYEGKSHELALDLIKKLLSGPSKSGPVRGRL
jgi:hypothetical protein